MNRQQRSKLMDKNGGGAGKGAGKGAALKAIHYQTGYGPGTLVWRDSLLVAHTLPGVPARQTEVLNIAPPETSAEINLVGLMEAYFSAGSPRPRFKPDELPLDRSRWTAFQSRVAAALAQVPPGETITYSALAEAAGHPGSQRAVGNFLAANPFPVIIPCHRVVRSDGALGGFSGGEGWKASLLDLEGHSHPLHGKHFPGRG